MMVTLLFGRKKNGFDIFFNPDFTEKLIKKWHCYGCGSSVNYQVTHSFDVKRTFTSVLYFNTQNSYTKLAYNVCVKDLLTE